MLLYRFLNVTYGELLKFIYLYAPRRNAQYCTTFLMIVAILPTHYPYWAVFHLKVSVLGRPVRLSSEKYGTV